MHTTNKMIIFVGVKQIKLMVMKLTVTEDQSDFIKYHGINVCTSSGTYHYIPFWYKETDNACVFEECSPENIPSDLREAILEQRLLNK